MWVCMCESVWVWVCACECLIICLKLKTMGWHFCVNWPICRPCPIDVPRNWLKPKRSWQSRTGWWDSQDSSRPCWKVDPELPKLTTPAATFSTFFQPTHQALVISTCPAGSVSRICRSPNFPEFPAAIAAACCPRRSGRRSGRPDGRDGWRSWTPGSGKLLLEG